MITGLSNDDPVAAWVSSMGSPNDLIEATNRPLYKTNILNGLPAVLFDGTNDTLTSTNAITGLRHVFVVAQYNAATFNGFDGLIGFSGSSASDSRIIFTGDDTTNHWYYGSEGVGSPYRANYKLNGTVDTNMVAPMNSFAVIETSTTAWAALNETLAIGRDRDAAGRFWNGYLVTAFGYDNQVSSGEAAALRQKLYTKYALSGI